MDWFRKKGSLSIASSPVYDEDDSGSIIIRPITDDEGDGSAWSSRPPSRIDDIIVIKPLNYEILELLKSDKATEEDIIKLFDKITPENFDIDYQFEDNNNNTLLHEVAIFGKPEILKKLMEYKPKVDVKNSEGNTAVISLVKECIECSQDECSKVKEQGGDRTDGAGKPPLIKSDSQKSFRLSKEKIIPCKKHFACLQVLLKEKVDLAEKNKLGLSVLSYATMCNDQKREEYLKKLLSINEKGSFATELYQALESRLDIQFLEELDRIWPKIEDEKLLQFMFGKYTLLQIVCKNGMTESAKRLIDIGADLHFTPIIHHEPIQLACIFSRPEILKLILEKDEEAISIKSKNERNLIHSTVKNIADSNDAYECLKILLKNKDKIKINDADKHGRTPLHYAVLHDSDACVVELLENGAELDKEDNWKQTPLMNISESAFKKYLDNMITDGRNERGYTHDRDKKAKSDREKKSRNDRRGKNNKKKEKSRKLVFNFSNLFRKINPNDSKPKHKTSSTNSINQKDNEAYYSFPTELLHKIKKVKRLRHLIQHPVFGIIIYFKWLHIRVFFLLYLVLYFIFTIMFTAYVYMTEDRPLKKIGAKDELFEILGYNRKSTYMLASIRLVNIIDLRLYFILPLAGILALFIFFEWMKMTQSKWKYIDTDNIMRSIVIIFAVLVMLCLNTTLLNPYCTEIKAISVLLTWFELFLVIGKYPNLSYFVSTFRSASLNLFKFLSVHIVLLIGFAWSFHLLFRTYSTDNTFTNPFNSLFKTIIMLTSEFDASEIPFNEYSVVSHLIFIGYIFIATIVLFNLMIGIAFQHVDEMKKNPPLYKSLAQIYYIKHFEDNFSKNIIIRTLYNWLSPRICCQGEQNAKMETRKSNESKDSKGSNCKDDEMTLKVSVKGNKKEFNRYLMFDTYPVERVRMKDKPNENDTSEKWPINLCCLKISKLFHTLNDNVIENAQKIVSKRFSKNEELKQEDLNLKANFDILRNEMIELRRFVQKSFDDLKELVQKGETEES